VTKTLSFSVLLILAMFWATASVADEALQMGKNQEGVVSPGKSVSYLLSLKRGDFAETDVVTHGTKLIINVYDASGNKVRGFKPIGPEQKIGFIADSVGVFRLEVALDGNTDRGPYTVKLLRIVGLSERVESAPVSVDQPESPQINALRAASDAHRSNAVADFWHMVHAKGAPLIEPLKDDRAHFLVTFLYQGAEDTQNVLLDWPPYTFRSPDEYLMHQLAGTDVWYETVKVDGRERFMYSLGPNVPHIHSYPPQNSADTMSMLWAAMQLDPLNPKHWLVDADSPDVSRYNGVSAVEMPDAPPQPWLAKRQGVPAGTVEKRQFKSNLLKNEKEIAVYTPPGYSKGAKPYGVVILFDEKPYLDENIIPTPTILDNLIADHRIPPIVAILVDDGEGAARFRDLACNRTFSDFLSSELMPWARRLYNITTDPRQITLGGSSLGGLTAACTSLWHPDTFGNVLSQSGSFWWTPPKSDNPVDLGSQVEPNWVAKQFIASPKLPLRFYMDAGTEELDFSGLGGGILAPNRNLRDVLLAKGYEVYYREFAGGHDYLSWRGTLADGLILLMGNSSARR